MLIIKYIMLFAIFLSTNYVGIMISKKYQYREKELKEMKTFLNIFATKIKLTYEPIPKIFGDIGNSGKSNVNKIFKIASENMKETSAEEAWKIALKTSNTNLKKEDIEVLKGLSNLLGKVDLEGQVAEITLVDTFLNSQIKKAEEESKKSTKLYKTLGAIVGLTIVIILI